jgi:NtrC-family two-component system response regulator AlgB
MTDRGSILIVDDEPNILKTLSIGLGAIGFGVEAFRNPAEALDRIGEVTFDIAFIDLMMQPIDGMQLLKEIKKRTPQTSCVIVTAHGTIDSAVEAIKLGASDFLQKPFDLKELQVFTERVFENHQLREEVRVLREQLLPARQSPEIVTRNVLMRRQLDLALQVADSQLTVLIEGESGTGKELMARYIHDHSPRRDGPFVRVNCAALAETLLESELFGHTKGAFTGAIKDREGRFESAGGGSIFLDEIGEVSPAIQVKLLRFLQSREFERVGENVTRKVDVRVIAATNRKLADALLEGSFRDDLYYRLNAVRIVMPSLRERPEDILLLAFHFLKRISAGGKELDIAPESAKLLTAYRWPGNVRELENVMERAALLARDGIILPAHLPQELASLDESVSGLLSLEEIERQHIARVLRMASDLDEASRILEIDPATLWRKRKKFGL